MKKIQLEASKIKEALMKEINSGKHAYYQVLPQRLESLLGDVTYSPCSRFEPQRMEYITSKISFERKRVIDIGCNMGYFTLSALELGAGHVTSYEGVKSHAEFVTRAAMLMEVDSRVTVRNQYFNFNELDAYYDIAILLNVLHHVGDDYGDQALTINEARESIINQLNSMKNIADNVIFQLGFNWRGNRNYGLFEDGTKIELIEFIKNGVKEIWNIDFIGIAKKDEGGNVIYSDLNNGNIERYDQLGEFLNRPLFILRKI